MKFVRPFKTIKSRIETPLLQIEKHDLNQGKKSRLQINHENGEYLEEKFEESILGGSHNQMLNLKASEYIDPEEYLQNDTEPVSFFTEVIRSKSVSDLSQVSSLTRTCSLPNLSFCSFESLFDNRKRQERAFSREPAPDQPEDLDSQHDFTESLASLKAGLRIVSANLSKERASDFLTTFLKIIRPQRKESHCFPCNTGCPGEYTR